MSFHINNIVKGVFYHLRNIAKIRKYINATTDEVQVLVHAFINSKLDFCNSLLHGLPKYEINKLQSVQNAAAGVIDVIHMFNKFGTLGRGYCLEEYNDEDFRLRFPIRKTRSLTS